MILVDTSVWIWHLRGGVPDLAALLEERQVLMHPLVVGELACGNLPRRPQVLRELKELPRAPEVSHDEALLFIESNKLMGRGIGYPDMCMLASALLADDAKLWTYDLRLAVAAEGLGISWNP